MYYAKTQIDVWGLSEISNNDTFNRLMDSLPQYAGIIAPINQTQKTAVVYDTGLFKVVYSKIIITDKSYDFASGRFPFEVAMVPKYGDPTDTLIFIVIHLKANVGNASEKQQSWQRRQNASNHLKNYLDQTHTNKKVILFGDFNDDTDTSIYGNNPSPFKNILQDPASYKFLTTALSASDVGSTVGRTDMIDHQMVSDELFSSYTPNSCQILPLQNYISSFSSSTSDHYPVFASYSYQFVGAGNINPQTVQIYPNPLRAGEKLSIDKGQLIGVYDMNGKSVNPDLFTHTHYYRQPGTYLLHLKNKDEQVWKKMVVQ